MKTITHYCPSDSTWRWSVVVVFRALAATLLVAWAGVAMAQTDFGDAPDTPGAAGYFTLLANGGAAHTIAPLGNPVRLGSAIDAEADGQPVPPGWGDDVNPGLGPDDEDGVLFHTALISGVPNTITVITPNPGTILQGWLDFNADGDWADLGEQIIVNRLMTVAGANSVTYQVGALAGVGPTYARFRLSGQGNLGVAGLASNGEVEDYEIQLDAIKWLQPPDLTSTGVDVDNEVELADDFLCTLSGPITDIHIWGSFRNDEETNGIPVSLLTNLVFQLSIYSDVPVGPGNPLAYSHPGNLLWATNFQPGQYRAGLCAHIPQGEWWHSPQAQPTPPGVWQFPGDFNCYQFDFYPQQPFTQTNGTVYWLAVKILVQEPGLYFGWKSSTNHWNDDAVWFDGTMQPPWRELRYYPPHPWGLQEPVSMDLAFALSTEEEEPELYDFGDAPDAVQGTGPGDYQTVLADNGAYHAIVVGGPYFDDGTQTDQPDAEADGQPNPTATGDDTNGTAPDDEDGVIIPVLTVGQVGSVLITVDDGQGGGGAGQAWVDGWIDFNADGDWLDAGEQICSGWQVQGPNAVAVNVPGGAAVGQTFARFRINSVGPLASVGGPAVDGEVEDHIVTIVPEPEQFDWGDAPDPTYPTLAANNGPNHLIVPGILLGTVIDGEGNGQPDPNALGDDNNPLTGPDDEDGAAFTSLVFPGQLATVQVTVSTNGYLNVWVDFNGDGDWTDGGEQIYTDQLLAAGTTSLSFPVPGGAVPGLTFARFRFCTVTGVGITGPASDGEVEDHQVRIDELDYGDAPDPTYPTYLTNNGARHVVGLMFLGVRIDSELDGQPNATATGDDNNPPMALDDEDGVVFPTALVAGVKNTIRVQTSIGGFLQAWLDLNADGDWADLGEQVILNQALGPGVNAVTFPVPATLTTNAVQTFMRFRLSGVQNLGYTGLAPDGEVEDYQILLQPIKWLQRPEEGIEGVDVDNANVALADDFLCTASGPITDIHIWGSFFNDVLPVGGPTNMVFRLRIWSDVPAGVDAAYSHPGTLLWTGNFTPATFDAGLCVKTKDGEWWHDPASGPNNWIFPADTNIYQFDFYIDPTEAFEQVEGTIYWLEVKYLVQGGQDFTFGWKTTYEDWNDAACWFSGGVPVPWQPIYYGDGHPRANTAWTNLNFAFALSGQEAPVIDWGDAPDPTYPTLSANGGASHIIVGGLCLGNLIDAERDGQPNATATGDDVNNLPDEDGVTFTLPLYIGQSGQVSVVASAPGLLNAWLDFGRDGSWAQAGDQIFNNLPVLAGPNVLNFPIPPGAAPGNTFARFRLSTLGGLSYTNQAPDGEVEDYAVRLDELTPDLGDAPDSSNNAGANMTAYPLGGPAGVVAQYPTVFAGPVPVGPRHAWPKGIAHLGPLVTGELEADSGPDQDLTNNIVPVADSPDLDGADDGVQFPLVLPHCRQTTLKYQVNVVNPSPTQPMYANVWFDWNRDGDWNDTVVCPGGAQVTEWAVQNQLVNVGLGGLIPMVSPPFTAWHPTLSQTSIWMRITLSEQMWPPPGGTTPVGGEGPTGGYEYGETEDYYVTTYDTDEQLDFGDAPAPYPTLLPLGAHHNAVPNFSLGLVLDTELNGLPDVLARGDDTNNLADEDGVSFTTPLVLGSNACVNVQLTSGPAGGFLDGWVDLNKNGAWDASDQVFTAQALVAGPNPGLCFPVPTNAVLGTNHARFRLSSVGNLPPTGGYKDGEVEDYLVTICQRKLATNVVITNIVVTNLTSQQVVTLQWNAEVGAVYQMQDALTLSNSPITWSNVGPQVIGPANTLVLTNAHVFERYYRVCVPYVCP